MSLIRGSLLQLLASQASQKNKKQLQLNSSKTHIRIKRKSKMTKIMHSKKKRKNQICINFSARRLIIKSKVFCLLVNSREYLLFLIYIYIYMYIYEHKCSKKVAFGMALMQTNFERKQNIMTLFSSDLMWQMIIYCLYI